MRKSSVELLGVPHTPRPLRYTSCALRESRWEFHCNDDNNFNNHGGDGNFISLIVEEKKEEEKNAFEMEAGALNPCSKRDNVSEAVVVRGIMYSSEVVLEK